MVNTVLDLELVPAEVFCRACAQRAQITSRWSVCCPACQSAEVDLLRGNEFLVTSVEVSEAFTHEAGSRKVK